MITAPTRSQIDAIITGLRDDDADTRHDALISLGHFAGAGEPTDTDRADDLGPDYICALDNGTIVAWGADLGRGGREVIYL